MARRSDPVAERPRHGGLGRYLLDGERIVTAVHQHWAKVAAPLAAVAAGLVLVLALDASLPAGLGVVANLLWWAWFFLVGRALWRVLEWRHDWFVATDKRLILTYGLVTHKVAMMPLAKVTDMSYNRSLPGRLLGFGTFVMESAGQDQALHRVKWVADPDHTYRAICAEIFGVYDHERVVDQDEHDNRFGGDQPPQLPSPYAGYVPPAGHSGLDGPTAGTEGPNGPANADYSTAIPIRPAGSQPDDRDSGIHEADTGPIPYWRPTTDDGDL